MPAPTTDLSSNWKKLQAKLQAEKKPTGSSTTESTTTSNGIKRKRPIDKTSSTTTRPPTRYIKAKLTGDNTSALGKKRKMGSYMSSAAQAEPSSTTKSLSSLTTDHDIPAADLAAAYGSSHTRSATAHVHHGLPDDCSPSH